MLNLRSKLFLGICFCLTSFLNVFEVRAQTSPQSTVVASVPSWFSHCSGENGTCPVNGSAQVIFGPANGSLPASSGTFLSQTVSSNILCSATVFGDPAPGQSKACWYGPTAGAGAGRILAPGGSNYPFFVQNNGVWDGNQRLLVGLYHLDPTLVEAQLRQMYSSGQRGVTLVMWYMPFISSTNPVPGAYTVWPDVWVAWLNSGGGQLSSQAQQNLTAICGLIKQIGFQRLTVRFAPVGSTANPATWSGWNEDAFRQDEAFTFNTRQLVESALAGSSVSRMYDLGIEMAGIPHNLNADGVTYADGQSPSWVERMWSDYVNAYGTSDSYGASIAYITGSLTGAIAQFDYVGVRPTTYGLDSYGNQDVWYIYQELAGAHDTAKPVIFQEVFYDDQAQMQAIQNQLQHVPLTISYIDQWPANTSYGTADGMIPPTNYKAYGGSGTPSGTITATPCTLTGGASTCTTQVSWATSYASNVVLYVNGAAAANLPNITTSLTGTATVTLDLSSTTLLLVSSQGVLANLGPVLSASDLGSGQSLLDSRTLTAIDPTAPVLTSAGLGGASNQSVWALGSNLSSGCSVQVYAPGTAGSSNPIASFSSVNCAPTFLGFALPDFVSKTYASIDFTVTNPGSQPSSPYHVAIQAIPTLSVAGLGGNLNQAIWAIGYNISPSCSVSLYDPASTGSGPLTTLSGLTCGPNNVAFQIPDFIRSNYAAINLTVTNADGSASAPLLVSIQGGS